MSTCEESESQLRAIVIDSNTVQADFRQSCLAPRERWPMPRHVLRDVVDNLHRIVTTKTAMVLAKNEIFESHNEAAKTAVAAARVLVSIEAQNLADEHFQIKQKAARGPIGSVNVNNTAIAVHDGRQFLAADSEYVEFLRVRAAREDGYSSHAGSDPEPMTLETGLTATGDRTAVGGFGEWAEQLTDPDAPLTTLGDGDLLPGMGSRDVPRRFLSLDDV